MKEALPWRVSGIEPDIRDDALHAAHAAGMTLGQWLNGIIRDSLIDVRAAKLSGQASRPAPQPPEPVAISDGGESASHFQPQQQMASQTMPPFTAQQNPQFAQPPHQPGYAAPYPYAPPPYAHPHPMAYAPYMPLPAAHDPAAYGMPYTARGYDPVEARLRRYGRGTHTAIPGAQYSGAPYSGGAHDDEGLLSVVDAAVGAMENSVRSSEAKTASALEALTKLIETGNRTRQPTASTPEVPADITQINQSLADLLERFSALESGLANRGNAGSPVSGNALSQAQKLESRLGDALDALNDRAEELQGGVRRPTHVRPSAPRASMPRGGGAVAEIAARQRMLDQPDARPIMSAENGALDAIRRSIVALSQQVREITQDQGKQSDFDVRAELKNLQTSVQDLAPQRIVASVNESIRALAKKIETTRNDGARDINIAPVEKLVADMRRVTEDIREPKAPASVLNALDRLSSRVEDLGAKSIDPLQISDFQRQFGEIRMLIAQAQRQQPTEHLETQIDQLSIKLDALAERPRDGKAIAIVAGGIDDLRRQLERFDPDRIVAHIEQRGAVLEGLESRISDLAGRIEQHRAEPATDFEEITERLESRLEGLANLGPRMERLSAQMEAVRTQPEKTAGFDALTSRIERMTQSLQAGGPGVDISGLEKRMSDIQTAIESNSKQPNIGGLEQILRKLAERIETVRAPAASGASLDALQNQIVSLAERLERTAAPVQGGQDSLERLMGDLSRQIGGLKETAAMAAQEAVREVMAASGAGSQSEAGMDSLAAEGMLLIKRDLNEMKGAQKDADARSRETLQNVNATLQKIVTRLMSLESGLSTSSESSAQPAPRQEAPRQETSRVAPAPHLFAPDPVSVPMPPQIDEIGEGRAVPPLVSRIDTVLRTPAAAQVAARPAPVQPMQAAPAGLTNAPSSANEHSLDMPLEPGLGKTPPTLNPEAQLDTGDPRANFIAAARRAAQAAATQSANVLNELESKGLSKDSKAALAAKASAGAGKLKEYVTSHKKPLLLGLAALIVSIGGMHVISNILFPGEEPVETSSVQERVLPAFPLGSKQAQLDQRLEQAMNQLNRMPAQDTSASIAKAPASPVAASTPDQIVVGSIGNADTVKPPAEALPVIAAPLPPVTDLAAVVRAAPFNGPNRLKQAALNGNLSAVYEVGSRLAEGRGVPRDVKAAAVWLEYAAQQGFAPAQYRIGSFHREGIGKPQSAKDAFVWFQRAAEQGHILAMHNLAVLHAEGVNGSPDYATAATWFRTAAEYGVKDSQFNVAILFVRGLGVAHDMNEAYKWFSAAAAQGDPDAIKKRDEVAARLPQDKLVEAKANADAFRAKRPDVRSNEVAAPEGGWDQEAKPAKSVQKKIPGPEAFMRG